jgi:hypothetical protein
VIETWHTGVEIEVLNLMTSITTIYPSFRAAARALKIEHSTIRKYCLLGVPYQNTYVFKKK